MYGIKNFETMAQMSTTKTITIAQNLWNKERRAKSTNKKQGKRRKQKNVLVKRVKE